MAVDQRKVLEVLFAGLGLGPAPERPADAEEFELDDARCTVARAPSGTEVTLRLTVGALTPDPHAAADRLRRLMRLTLGLAMVNRAALVCADPPDDAQLRGLQGGAAGVRPLRFDAVALIASERRDEIFGALQDVVQLRSLALPHLVADAAAGGGAFPAPRDMPAGSRGGKDSGPDSGAFLIFQP